MHGCHSGRLRFALNSYKPTKVAAFKQVQGITFQVKLAARNFQHRILVHKRPLLHLGPRELTTIALRSVPSRSKTGTRMNLNRTTQLLLQMTETLLQLLLEIQPRPHLRALHAHFFRNTFSKVILMMNHHHHITMHQARHLRHSHRPALLPRCHSPHPFHTPSLTPMVDLDRTPQLQQQQMDRIKMLTILAAWRMKMTKMVPTQLLKLP
mmetsp:Transcript_17378/g.34132  ORF Transcript_17378/g.34132 Transcript_17378/m.34132 type:complete len:209 (+) Transcript_17378:1116-1742(+)